MDLSRAAWYTFYKCMLRIWIINNFVRDRVKIICLFWRNLSRTYAVFTWLWWDRFKNYMVTISNILSLEIYKLNDYHTCWNLWKWPKYTPTVFTRKNRLRQWCGRSIGAWMLLKCRMLHKEGFIIISCSRLFFCCFTSQNFPQSLTYC